MMKKTVIFFILIQICIAAFAQGNNIGLIPVGDENVPKGNKAPPIYPMVVYNNSVIIVTNSYSFEQLQIIIRDEDGDIIYNNVVSFIPPTLTLPLPTEVDEEKYSIELLYGDWHLIGYF